METGSNGEAWAAIAEREDGSDRKPVLAIYRACYSICPRVRVTVEVVVYPDGTAVTVDRRPPGDHDSPFQLRTLALTSADLDHLSELILAAGLTNGGVRLVGNREGAVDGYGIVFEAQIGSTFTHFHVPQLDPEDPEPDRRVLNDLRAFLQAQLDEEAGTVLPPNWVMLGEAITGDTPTFSWEGPDRPQGEPPCLAFDPAQLPDDLTRLISQEEHESMRIAFGDATYAMVGRHLLPHEAGCCDVQSQVDRVRHTEDALLRDRAG
jgi:hypothetical protein